MHLYFIPFIVLMATAAAKGGGGGGGKSGGGGGGKSGGGGGGRGGGGRGGGGGGSSGGWHSHPWGFHLGNDHSPPSMHSFGSSSSFGRSSSSSGSYYGGGGGGGGLFSGLFGLLGLQRPAYQEYQPYYQYNQYQPYYQNRQYGNGYGQQSCSISRFIDYVNGRPRYECFCPGYGTNYQYDGCSMQYAG